MPAPTLCAAATPSGATTGGRGGHFSICFGQRQQTCSTREYNRSVVVAFRRARLLSPERLVVDAWALSEACQPAEHFDKSDCVLLAVAFRVGGLHDLREESGHQQWYAELVSHFEHQPRVLQRGLDLALS